jgi:DNA-directed RNA polymerase specialized sigma subunit
MESVGRKLLVEAALKWDKKKHPKFGTYARNVVSNKMRNSHDH